MKKRFLRMDEWEQRERLHREQRNVLRYAPESAGEDTGGEAMPPYKKGIMKTFCGDLILHQKETGFLIFLAFFESFLSQYQ